MAKHKDSEVEILNKLLEDTDDYPEALRLFCHKYQTLRLGIWQAFLEDYEFDRIPAPKGVSCN